MARDSYTLEHLRNWSETTRDAHPPIQLGIFGDPIEHSLSPQMQNAALRDCGIAMRYSAFHVQAHQLRDALSFARENHFIGLNLTVPHKIAAVSLMDARDETAEAIGAINTIRFAEGRSDGFNTDGSGFARAVREAFSVDLRDLRVLLLGGGGAARAIAFQCALENSERLVIANRDLGRATRLVDELRPRFSGPRVLGPVARIEAVPLNSDALRFQLSSTDLLVNATPLGLRPTDTSPIPPHLLAPHLLVFDTVYGASETPLIRAAAAAGARGCDGRAMLLHQGAAAFEIWFNRAAPVEAMRRAL